MPAANSSRRTIAPRPPETPKLSDAASARRGEAPIGGFEWIALGGILLIAAAARFYRLDASLWYDEIDTLVNFVRLPTRQLVATFDSTNNHMFYSLQAQAAIAMFSENAWALRLPAVVFGMASLVAVWALARYAVGRVQALVTVFLLAVSYHHVWFSQNARGYTGLLFWAACATLLFARGLDRPTWRTWTFYAICVAAALYTHLSALFFFAGHGVVYVAMLIRNRRRDPSIRHAMLSEALTIKPMFGFVLGGVLSLLLYAPILPQVLRTVHAQTASSSRPDTGLGEWLNPLRAVREVAVSLSGAGPFVPMILVASLVAFGVGAVALVRRRSIVAAVYLLHFPIATLVLLALHGRIWPRYFFVDIGCIYLCVVHGTFLLCGYAATHSGLGRTRPHALHAVTATAVVVMTAGSLWLLARNYAYPKQDFAGAAAYVERERGTGDVVASIGLARLAFQRLYAPQWAAVDSVEELDTLRASAPRTWVVVAFPSPDQGKRAQFASRLESDFDRVAVLPGTLGDGAIWIYRSHAR